MTCEYFPGFGSHFSSEALPGALPLGQNSPQTCPYGLYAEQLSGTAFTVPRSSLQRSWLYRMHPSVGSSAFRLVPNPDLQDAIDMRKLYYLPNQMRWDPFDLKSITSSNSNNNESKTTLNFIQGLRLISGAGDPTVKHGVAIYIYCFNENMLSNSAFYNSDGDFLFVPQEGELQMKTEFGLLQVKPTEICVLQRGIKFNISSTSTFCRGYILEVFDGHFELPDLGPIGANGLANPRDFLHPKASFDKHAPGMSSTLFNKFGGRLYEAEHPHSSFDVVAWHGNYVPYKYDLSLFNAVNSVTFDHADPSIFTVLTCKSTSPGVAIADFVIFPPRWVVTEHTFRPPYYHRNVMSEFMGNIQGNYDAKPSGGFVPGGASLHPVTSAHGPDALAFHQATTQSLVPVKIEKGSLSIMFESYLMLGVSDWSLTKSGKLQKDYYKVWSGLPVNFKD